MGKEKKSRYEHILDGLRDIATSHNIGKGSLLYRVMIDTFYNMLKGEVLPAAKFGQKTKDERQQGGKGSWGLTPEERQERNKLIQEEIDRLCLEKDMTYNSACNAVSQNISKIHPLTDRISLDRVKKVTKNPHKKTSL